MSRIPFLRKPLPHPSEHDASSIDHSDWHHNLASAPSTYSSLEIVKSSSTKDTERSLERHLSLFDLIAVGVGGTVGSGLFVLCGLVSREYAGPAAVFSWAIAGVAALISGSCYAELAGRIPLSGGAYAYSFVALGEWPAFLTAVCLSFEYVGASGAVARSWADKLALYIMDIVHENHWLAAFARTYGTFSPLALLLSTAVVALLLTGIKESKQTANFFTALKVSLCFFMVLMGAFYVNPVNWTPFLPPSLGVAGVFRGASGTFFGYLGYDQLCGLAGEAVNPRRNLPLAVLFTLTFVGIIYMAASLILTGMQPWQDISPVSGFPAAFHANGADLAAHVCAIGELVTMPIVVLITIMVQPRLQYALAEDGLLPLFFRKLNESGNLWNGSLTAGTCMILIATFVPFQHLNDVISCAVLVVLSLTDSSVILLWHEAPDPESNLAHYLVTAYHGMALLASFLLTRATRSYAKFMAATFAILLTGLFPILLQRLCPRTTVFGGRRHHYHEESLRREEGYYRAPFLPFLPCIGIFINCYLIVQLSVSGIVGLWGSLAVASIYYFQGHSGSNSSSTPLVTCPEDFECATHFGENSRLRQASYTAGLHPPQTVDNPIAIMGGGREGGIMDTNRAALEHLIS